MFCCIYSEKRVSSDWAYANEAGEEVVGFVNFLNLNEGYQVAEV